VCLKIEPSAIIATSAAPIVSSGGVIACEK
jgi:hypothetical protein